MREMQKHKKQKKSGGGDYAAPWTAEDCVRYGNRLQESMKMEKCFIYKHRDGGGECPWPGKCLVKRGSYHC